MSAKWNKYKHCYEEEWLPKHIWKDIKQNEEIEKNKQVKSSKELPKYEDTVDFALSDFFSSICV